MATMTKSVSGTATTYVITGNNAATCTVVADVVGVQGLAVTSISTSGNLLPDALQQLDVLVQLLTTGLLGDAQPPVSGS